jgi:putative oxidoreductase
VNEGLLLLRLLLGTLMAGHALQKLLGWFGGHGIAGTVPLFELWGLTPARTMVAVAGCSELLGAGLIMTGTLTALGVTLVVGTMVVAGSVSTTNGLWAINQGYELPLVYGLLGLGIGLVGPGHLSVDYQAGLMNVAKPGDVLIGAAAALAGSAPLVLRVIRARRVPPVSSAPHGTLVDVER